MSWRYRMDAVARTIQGDEAMIDLTKDEAYAICDFIDLALYDRIRNDTDIDSLQWLKNILHAYEKLCAFSGYVGLTEDEPKEDGDEIGQS